MAGRIRRNQAGQDGPRQGRGFSGTAKHGIRHGFGAPGTAEHGIETAQMNAVAHHSPASEYMTFVQPESGHGAASHLVAEGPPGMAEQLHTMADTMGHAGYGPQEPPPADHLFADAQLDHGGIHGADSDAHAATFHADVPAVAPTVSDDP